MKNYFLILFFVFSGVKAAEGEPAFSLKNKSPKPILVTLEYGETSIKLYKLESQRTFISHQIVPLIQLSIYEDSNIDKLVDGVVTPVLTLLYSAVFAPVNQELKLKTIYIKWKSNGLSPQKGKNGRTTQGYSLDNNIAKDEVEAATV